jgi:hypothetical protein
MIKNTPWLPTHIIKTETINSGGNVMLDMLHLSNGKLIVVSDDVVCVYPSAKYFNEGGYEQALCIHFSEVRNDVTSNENV